MMILRSSPPSPFGRKIKLALGILGLTDQVEVQNADTLDPDDSVRQQNPLGKIPALILEDGQAVHDSRIILDYLDHKAGGGRIIPIGEDRYRVLTLASMADGIMDAALLQVYEGRFRPEDKMHDGWLTYQADKVSRGLAVFEADRPDLGETPSVAAITLACALGYLDLRFSGAWRNDHPNLVAWLDDFANRVPAFEATKIQ